MYSIFYGKLTAVTRHINNYHPLMWRYNAVDCICLSVCLSCLCFNFYQSRPRTLWCAVIRLRNIYVMSRSSGQGQGHTSKIRHTSVTKYAHSWVFCSRLKVSFVKNVNAGHGLGTKPLKCHLSFTNATEYRRQTNSR